MAPRRRAAGNSGNGPSRCASLPYRSFVFRHPELTGGGGATAMRSSATHLDTRLLTRVAAQVVLMANTWYRNSDGIADYESGDAGFAF